MSDRLLLITSEDDFQELAAYGGLPDSLLKSVAPEDLLSSLEAAPPWIVACPPEDVLPQQRNAQARRDAARLCNSLIDRTVCTLAVIGDDDQTPVAANDADEQSVADEAIEPANSVESPLAAHANWQRNFRDEMHRHDPTRALHVRHVLILVCLRPLRGDELEYVQQLVAGDSQHKLFDLAYVMLAELEPGTDAGQLFYAAEAWPLAVGNLLLKLLHDPTRPVTGPTLTMAWRSLRLAPRLVADGTTPLEQTLFSQLVARLTGDATPDRAWDPHRLSKITPPARHETDDQLQRPDDGDFWMTGPWEEYHADRHMAEVSSDARWEQPLTAAGAQLAGELSGGALGEDSPANQEVAKVWQSVHQHPRYVYAALATCDALDGPNMEEQFDEVTGRWSSAMQHEADRSLLVEFACRCARHYEIARQSFLPLWKRWVVAGIVALALLIVASSCVGEMLNDWGVASTAIAFAIAGSAGAAWGSEFLERRAGRRARVDIGDQLDAIDEQVAQRHRACRAAVLSAHQFWQHLRVRSAVERLKATLRRLRRILDLELRDTSTRRAVTDEKDAGESAAQRRKSPDVHRRRYEQCIALTRDVDAEALTEHGAELAELVDDQAELFLHSVWTPLCEQRDPLRTGHLPARELIPALRRFCASFHQIAATQTTIIAIDRLTDADMAAWGRGLHQWLAYQEYFELASCRLLARHTADEKDRPAPTLILRRGLNYGPLVTHLEASRVRRLENDTAMLDAMPLVGLLHQELPVRLDVHEGQIAAAPYEKQ